MQREKFERFVELVRKIVCPICLDVLILSSPVQGPCEHAYCANCIYRYLKEKALALLSQVVQCAIKPSAFQFCKRFPEFKKIKFGKQKVRCALCRSSIELENLKSLVETCKGKENEPHDENAGAAQYVLPTPTTQPLSRLEEKMVMHLMERKLPTMPTQSSKHCLVHIKTGGRVSHFYFSNTVHPQPVPFPVSYMVLPKFPQSQRVSQVLQLVCCQRRPSTHGGSMLIQHLSIVTSGYRRTLERS